MMPIANPSRRDQQPRQQQLASFAASKGRSALSGGAHHPGGEVLPFFEEAKWWGAVLVAVVCG